MRNVFCWLLGAALIAPPIAHACSCIPAPPPLEAAAQCSVVFVGKVVAEHPQDKKRWQRHRLRERRFEFAVDEILHGTGKASFIVRTGWDSAGCGYHFVVGKSYLVYAHGEVTDLSTNICTRTAPLDSARATEDLAVLRHAKQRTPPPKK